MAEVATPYSSGHGLGAFPVLGHWHQTLFPVKQAGPAGSRLQPGKILLQAPG
jgi:hypothetical protein